MSSYLNIFYKISIPYNEKINKSCDRFFRDFNLNHFWYYKLMDSGNLTYLGANAAWMEYFGSEKLYMKYPYCRHPKLLSEGIYLHKDVEDEDLKEICSIGKEKFKLQMSMKIQEKCKDGIEVFGFSSSSSGNLQTALFLNEIPLFRLFAKWFRKNNSALFSKMEDNFVDLASLMGPIFYEESPILCPTVFNRQELLRELGITFSQPLSPREKDVAQLVVHSYSSSKIGKILFLSVRTIEHHIERLKEKLDCGSRTELIQKCKELEAIGYF